MRKYAIIAFVLIGAILIMTSCTSSKSENEAARGNDISIESIKDGVIKGDMVKDAATAQAIGDAVIKSVTGEEFNKLSEVNVSYNSQDKIWVITRSLGKDTLGGDYNCAIRESDGQIIKVWAGE